MKPKRPPRLPPLSESVEQEHLAAWLNHKQLLWTHVPNGGARHVVTAAKLKAQGVMAGVPDVLIFTRPPACPCERGVAIELKRTCGGRLSPDQKGWLDKLAQAGWLVSVQPGALAAIAWLQSLGY